MATCMAILHVGSTQQVRTGSTSSKEEDYENDAATIVQKCVSWLCGGRGRGVLRVHFCAAREGRCGDEMVSWRSTVLGDLVLTGF